MAIALDPDDARSWSRPSATRPTVVCLTPMKNEAWIIERFIACTALWADHIVIADQGSTDGSREIAQAHPKVTVVDNRTGKYDESARQRLLVDSARELVEGPRLFIALDADEILSAQWMESPEWKTILSVPPGTLLSFQRVELIELSRTAWLPAWSWSWGFMDDGSEHAGSSIHSDRVPTRRGAPSLLLRDIKVLHYAAADIRRLRSRQRWYQCWEVLNRPERRASDIFRAYHEYDGVPTREVIDIDPEWTAGYEREGIDMTSVHREGRYRWDDEVLQLIQQHGARTFRRVDIWNTDWNELAKVWGREIPAESLRDPRTVIDRVAAKWLLATQSRRGSLLARLGERALRLVGW